MSKEMREQINKVKNFGEFLNEDNVTKTISHFVKAKKYNEIIANGNIKPTWKHYIEELDSVVLGTSFALNGSENFSVQSDDYDYELIFDMNKIKQDYKYFEINGNRVHLQTLSMTTDFDPTAYEYESEVPDELFVLGVITPLDKYLINKRKV